MHRTLEMSVPSSATGQLLADLQDLDTVVGISVQRAASVRPSGDVVTVHVLNRGADAVMELARAANRAR